MSGMRTISYSPRLDSARSNGTGLGLKDAWVLIVTEGSVTQVFFCDRKGNPVTFQGETLVDDYHHRAEDDWASAHIKVMEKWVK